MYVTTCNFRKLYKTKKMKKIIIMAGAVAFLAACTSPKANTEAEEAVEVEEVAEAASTEYVVNGAESTVKVIKNGFKYSFSHFSRFKYG